LEYAQHEGSSVVARDVLPKVENDLFYAISEGGDAEPTEERRRVANLSSPKKASSGARASSTPPV
jgi:hypothetical protein